MRSSLLRGLFAAFLVLGNAGLAGATDQPADAGTQRLRVGSTGIFCVMSPCPWRGVIPADATGSPRDNLLWADDTLPQLEAGRAEMQRVRNAWNAFGCVVVDGRFDGATLTIDRIVGDC